MFLRLLAGSVSVMTIHASIAVWLLRIASGIGSTGTRLLMTLQNMRTSESRRFAVQSMAESLTPGQEAAPKERESLLKRVAKLAKQQGSFQLACKKYTQVAATASRHMPCSFALDYTC